MVLRHIMGQKNVLMHLKFYGLGKLILIFGFLFNLNLHLISASSEVVVPPGDKMRAINNYINFANESIHGMLIVNKLLENYNLDLNKYVDLDSYRINNYSNEDLPMDVFQDPDRMFFNNNTPYEWFDLCIKDSKLLDRNTADKLNLIATNIKKEITTINNLRFELDKATKNVDLSKQENIAKVYEKLETGVIAYNLFYKLQAQLSQEINKLPEIKKQNSPFQNLREVYGLCKTILDKIRQKDTDSFAGTMTNLKAKQQTFTKYLSQSKEIGKVGNKLHADNLMRSLDNFIISADEFITSGVVNDNYKIYGKFYYYHNIALLSKFNRYGSGLASEMNQVLIKEDSSEVLVMEQPHIFQIIYPKRLVDTPDLVASDDYIEQFPTLLKERKITRSTTVLKADDIVLDLLLYDHMIQDGDIVSINFNGDWILEKAELERAPQKLKLRLNKEGRNFLILHADNVGKRPPNTMGIKYTYRGISKELTLKSDLDKSELIEIIIQ